MAKYKVLVSGLNGNEIKNEIERFFLFQPSIRAKANIAKQEIKFRYNKKIWNKDKIDNCLDNLGFDKKEKGERKRMEPHLVALLFSVILSIPLLVFQFEQTRPNNTIALSVSLICATLLQFGVGGYFYLKVIQSLLNKKLRSSLPLMIATTLTYIYTVFHIVMFAQDKLTIDNDYNSYFLFHINALLFLCFNVSKAIEHSIVAHNEDYQKAISHFKIDNILKVDAEKIIECEVESIKKGDIIRVLVDQLVPIDGKIIAGFSYFDESMHSGDTRAIYHGADEFIRAGAVNKTNTIDIIVEKEWNEGILAKFNTDVFNAEKKEIELDFTLNSAYQITLIIALLATILALIYHFYFNEQSWAYSFATALSVLIVAMPVPLTLAKPVSTMMGLGKFDISGIGILNPTTLDKLVEADAIVFSHVGILTAGRPFIKTYQSLGKNYDDILYTLEKKSIFPLAKTIVSYLETLNAKTINMEIISLPMGRVKAIVNGVEYYFGSYASCRQMIKNSTELDDFNKENQEGSSIILFLIRGEEVLIKMAVVDKLKEAASPAIRRLVMEGVNPYIISSEKKKDALLAAKQVGVEESNTFFEISPIDKLDCYNAIKAHNHHNNVIFVGDSLNDAPCIFGADISITINDGNRFALGTGDIVLKNDDLTAIARIIVFAKKIIANRKINTIFGTLFPIIFIPIATFGYLNPLWAICFIFSCQILIALNALRIRTWKLY